MKNTLNLRLGLEAMKARSTLLCGKTAHPDYYKGLDNIFDRALKGVDDAEKTRKMAALIERARNKEAEAITELNALRSQTIDLYVRATSKFTMFFEEIPLKPDEQAHFQHTYRNEVAVRYIGQDGDAKQVKAVRAQKNVFFDMRELTTDEVVYPVRDINLGTDVAAAAQRTFDLGFDLSNKVDVDAKTLVDASIGAFVTTGAKLNRTYIPNTRIQTQNLPTTNLISLSDNGTGNGQSNLFRLNVIRQLQLYCAQWGDIFGAPLRPTGVILVPAIDSTGLMQEILPTGNTFNVVAQGVLQNYMEFDYMNTRWVLVPDVTIAQGACYPVLNRPLGNHFTKPSMDEEFVETNRRKNIESRVQMKVHQFAVPEPWRVNVCKIVYSSVYAGP